MWYITENNDNKKINKNSNNFQVEIGSARPSSRTSRTRKTTWTRFWTSSSNSKWRRPQIQSRRSRRRRRGRRGHAGSVSSFKTMKKLNIRSNLRQQDQVKKIVNSKQVLLRSFMTSHIIWHSLLSSENPILWYYSKAFKSFMDFGNIIPRRFLFEWLLSELLSKNILFAST